MMGEEKPVETPEEFLTALGERLGTQEGADVALAEILKTHILKTVPGKSAIPQAAAAILKLAEERANLQEAARG